MATAACAPGPNVETVLDELRIVAAVAEPPELMPGETTDLTLSIADPFGKGAVVLVWACTEDRGGCVENEDDLQSRVSLGTMKNQRFVTQHTLSDGLAAFAADEPQPTTLWMLACEPGLCDLIDAVEDARDGADVDVSDVLADPIAWVSAQPQYGLTLARKSLRFSTRDPAERNRNPNIDVLVQDLSLGPDEEFVLPVSVSDDTVQSVYGFASAGGFAQTAFDVLNGTATLRGYAPDTPGEVDFYVVADDGMGGTAVRTVQATVTP